MKTVVIGLDGAGFELIDPWIENGDLPNIARIKQEGVWGDMKSVLPPVTSPNWKCFSTGKNPGKIGIFWWENIDWRNRKVYYPAVRKLENREIWDYIGDAGMKVGVLGMPTTYPPKSVNGFFVSGHPDAQKTGFTYPVELEKELKRNGWKNHPASIIDIDRAKACRELYEMIDTHFHTAKRLAAKYNVDFLMTAVFFSNVFQHFLWNSSETKEAWTIIDRHIGKFMKLGCNVLIMSDHGSNKIETVFNINTWLEQEGYLRLNPYLADNLYKMGINQHSLAKFASRLGLLGLLRKIVPRRLVKNIPSESGEIQKEAKTNKIDWKKSKAFASGQGPIYLNPGNADNEVLKQEIKRKLEGLINPSTGEKVIENVYSKEEIYNGKYLHEAPDLIVDQAKGVHIPGGIGQRDVFDSPRRWQAENKKFGIFMAYGSDIKQVGEVENVSILDLAPTILHLMGIAIPADMDGRVLEQIFAIDSKAAKHPIHFVEVKESDRIKQKISHLKGEKSI